MMPELTTEERAVILNALLFLESRMVCAHDDPASWRGYFERQKACVQRIKTKLEEEWSK